MSQSWLKLDDGVKQQIKQLLLSTLPVQVPNPRPYRASCSIGYQQPVLKVQMAQAQIARHTAALAIAKVAAIELPAQQWQDLVSTLLANMNVQPPNNGLRQSTLEALGYVCEEMGKLEEDVLAQEQINSVLTAVVQVSRSLSLRYSIAGSLQLQHIGVRWQLCAIFCLTCKYYTGRQEFPAPRDG